MNYLYSVLILVAVYVLLSAGLNLIMGNGGIFHMGHGGFFAVGAYVSAILAVQLQLPFLLELLIAGLAAAAFGLLLGLPSIRLKGDYITFVTYGFAVVAYTVCNNWMAVTNGPVGISGVMRPKILGVSFQPTWRYLLLCVAVVSFFLWLVHRITASPYGMKIESIREDETAASASGINVASMKLQIFCVGAFLAGVAGTLYVHYMMICDPTGFKVATSSLLVSMVIIGGLGTVRGSVAGALLVVGLPEILGFLGIKSVYTEQIQNILYSLLLIVVINVRPQGIFGKLKM